MAAWAWVLLAAGGAIAQPARPVPTLFVGGACATDDACARERWSAFLARHGQAELSGQGPALRYWKIDAEPACAGGAPNPDGVHVRRFDGQRGVLEISDCGARREAPMSVNQASNLRALLDWPPLSDLSGFFPAYCPEDHETGTHLIEALSGGRYRLIEWDCEPPVGLQPVLERLGLDDEG